MNMPAPTMRWKSSRSAVSAVSSGIFRNQFVLPGQACVVVGVARVVEDLLVLDDVCEQSAIDHSGLPMFNVG